MSWRPGHEPEPTPWWMWPLGILFIALCVLAYAGWAEWLHGDWRCAFAQCRIETP